MKLVMSQIEIARKVQTIVPVNKTIIAVIVVMMRRSCLIMRVNLMDTTRKVQS